MKLIEKFKKWYRGLPDKKRYVEFVTALLTIPVLITILVLNLGSLKKEEKKEMLQSVKITVIPIEKEKPATPATTGTAQCKREVGPVEISTPKEEETVTQEPVCFTVSYKDDRYCSVVWSYRIDNGSSSDFSDKSVCLYNVTPGEHKFELRVKSVVSNDEVNLVRNFVFKTRNPTPTITPSVTPTPTL